MQFTRNGRWLMVSRITGPTHNLLQVDLASAAGAPSIEPLPAVRAHSPTALDANQVLKHVIAGVDAANREFGTSYRVGAARFVSDDSRPEKTYEELAYALVRHLARGEPFAEP